MVRTILLRFFGTFAHVGCVASLLYIQDCHEVVPVPRHNETWGDLARLATVLKAHNTSHTDIVFGGDLAGGALFGTVYKGVPMIDAFNQLGVTLANFGQHDFDFGYHHTLDLRRHSHFPWISSNLVNASTHMPFVNTTHVVRQHGNLCLGYLGLTTDMNSTVDAGVLEEPIVGASRRSVAALGDVDAIVAVTQLNNASAWALMRAVPSIRILLREEDSAESLGLVDEVSPGRFIVSPRGDCGTVTEVSFAKIGTDTEVHTHVYNVDGSVREVPEFLCLQTKLERALNETLAERVGTASQPFSAAETGHLVTDAYRHQSGAQLAWQGSGGIRATIPAGPIPLRSLYSVLLFGNALAVICVTGADMQTALQRTLDEATDTTSFPYVSGVDYAYARYGAHYRLVNVTVDGRRLDTRAPYSLVLPNFHVSDVFPNAKFQANNISTDVFALIHAVQAWHTVRPSPSRSIPVS